MNIIYNNTLPNPPDDPAVDVGGMQTNTQSIQSIWAQDHFSFNNDAVGWHQFVHLFNTTAPPLASVSATADGVLFSKSNNPFWANAANPAGQQLAYVGNSSITDNGFITIGSLIIQWGMFDAVAGSNVVPFPTEFLNNVFSITTTMIRNSTNVDVIYVRNVPSTLISFTAFNTSSGNSFYWMAIGN